MKYMIPLLFLALSGCAQVQADGHNPLAAFNHDWERDAIWHDGKAEVAQYDATRTVYDQTRHYIATIYTNKEAVAGEPSFTKSADGGGRMAFKNHTREDIPTQNYDYHYSTMCYVGAEDFQSLKLDMGSQEDCGASYKQFIHHDGELAWHQFSYFPDQGHRAGESDVPAGFVFQDALGVVLRGYPFDQPREITLSILPNQTTTKWSPVKPVPMTVSYVGEEVLDLPVGETEAHHLRVTPDSAEAPAGTHDYWFAADGTAPTLHVMVKYQGPGGQTYALRSLDRGAYWER